MLKIRFMDILERLNPDCIYVVNLKARLDRLLRFDAQMRALHLEYRLIDAVDGATSFACQRKLHNIISRKQQDSGLMGILSAHDFSVQMQRANLAAVAYLESQRLVMQDAINNKYDSILVFDDDVIIDNSPQSVGSDFLSYLDAAKIFLPGCSEYAAPDQIACIDGKELLYHPVPGQSCGSFAVFYRREMFAPVMKYIDEGGLPYDNVILGNLYKKHTRACLASKRHFVLADVTDSELRDGKRQLEYSLERNWPLRPWLINNEPILLSIILSDAAKPLELNMLDTHIGKNIFLNFYYTSRDGLRPFHPGGIACAPADLGLTVDDPESAFTAENMGAMLEEKNLPFSEFAILWKEGDINVGNIKEFVRRLISLKEEAGELNGKLWARKVGRSHIPALHSVIIPIDGETGSLADSVQSVLDQTTDNVELILVQRRPDTNLDLESIRKLFSGHPSLNKKYMRLLKAPAEISRTAALNMGVRHSFGEYISFLEPGALYHKNRLMAAQAVIEASMNIKTGGACCAFMTQGDEKGREAECARAFTSSVQADLLRLETERERLNLNAITCRRAYFYALNGFNEFFDDYAVEEFLTRYFENFVMERSDYIGIIPPKKQAERHYDSAAKLLAMRQKYLAHFRLLLRRSYPGEITEIAACHKDAIYRHFPDMGKEEAERMEQVLLKSVLDERKAD